MSTITDTEVVDAIALGLGTKPEWSYEDLEWIGEVIALVREHPGHEGCMAYYEAFKDHRGKDPERNRFLHQFLGLPTGKER